MLKGKWCFSCQNRNWLTSLLSREFMILDLVQSKHKKIGGKANFLILFWALGINHLYQKGQNMSMNYLKTCPLLGLMSFSKWESSHSSFLAKKIVYFKLVHSKLILYARQLCFNMGKIFAASRVSTMSEAICIIYNSW